MKTVSFYFSLLQGHVFSCAQFKKKVFKILASISKVARGSEAEYFSHSNNNGFYPNLLLKK